MTKFAGDVVYQLSHSYKTRTCGDDIKSIGTYTSEAEARQAIERLKVQPGFKDLPNGFFIETIPVDTDLLPNGFITVVEPGVDDSDLPPELTRHVVRPAPDGYVIHERIKRGRSLGCEVRLTGRDDLLAEGLGYPEAREWAEKHRLETGVS